MPEEEISFYDEDDVYRSHRYPNLSGGQQNASASPEQNQDLETEEPRSQVAIKRKHEASLEHIHGDHAPKASLPVLVNLLNTNIEILKTMKNIKDLMEYQIPLGRTYAFTVQFPAGATFAHIDFTNPNPQSTFGVPTTTFLNLPGRKLAKLKIFNDGPGTIKFGSNTPFSDRTADVQLNAGEFDDSLSFNYTLIETLNIAVLGNSPTVRIFCVF